MGGHKRKKKFEMSIITVWKREDADDEEEEDNTAEAAPDVGLWDQIAPATNQPIKALITTNQLMHMTHMKWN